MYALHDKPTIMLDADKKNMCKFTSECALSKSCCSWRRRASAWPEADSASRSAAAARALSRATLLLAFCLSLSIMSCMGLIVMELTVMGLIVMGLIVMGLAISGNSLQVGKVCGRQ